jgi:hypothetical protein
MLGFRRRGVSGTALAGLGGIAFNNSLPLIFGEEGPEDWELAAGHYQNSIHTLALWMPPSTQAYAYHKRAPAGYPHRLRYPIAGGPHPLYYTLNSGPAGASFNNDYEDPDFGALTIPNVPLQSGTLSFTASPQGGGAPLTISHSYEGRDATDTSLFCFLTDGSGGAQTGSPSAPKRDIGQIIGPDEDDAAWVGRQIIMEGDHTIGGHEAEYNLGGSRLIMNTNKPAVWRAATLHGARFRSGGNTTTGVGGAEFHFENGNNVKFQGLQWAEPLCNQIVSPQQTRNCFIHAASPVFAGGGTQDNDFDCTTIQASGSSNSCAIFYASAQPAQYCAHIGDQFRNCANVGPLTVYATTFLYLGNLYLPDQGTDVGLFLKGGANLDDIAFVYCRGFGLGSLTKIQSIEGGPIWSRQRIEILHCKWNSTGTTANLGRPIWLQGAAPSSSTYSVYVTRSNLRGLYNYAQTITAGSINMRSSVMQHNGTFTEGWRVDSGPSYVPSNNLTATTGLLDAQAAQAAPNYTEGAEIG